MSCINIHSQFLSCLQFNPHQSSYWNAPTFMKSSSEALHEVETLKIKIKEFETFIGRNRLRNSQDEESKRLHNLRENLKVCENRLGRLKVMDPDMKTSDREFLDDYKTSILATLEMKILETGLKFKTILEKSRLKPQSANLLSSSEITSQTAPNLNRPLFIEQTQEELFKEAAVNEYKHIEQEINKISEMYKKIASTLHIHQLKIDNIEGDVNSAELHVDGGRKHLVTAHQRESKNRSFIIKVFACLSVLSTIHIVVLS